MLNSNELQQNMQLNKKKMKQLESQTYSNRTMARLIATAELYALSLGYENPQLYKKYDQFNNLKRKNKDELEGELILQIQCCQVSMNSYINKYKTYDFPEDFEKEKTLMELDKIRKKVPNKHKRYFSAIIKLIQGDTNIQSFDEALDELENDDEYERSDIKNPESQLKMDIPIMRYVDSVKTQVKNKYIKNPAYKFKLELNKPFEKNEYFESLNKIQKEIDYGRKDNKPNKPVVNNKPRENMFEEYY